MPINDPPFGPLRAIPEEAYNKMMENEHPKKDYPGVDYPNDGNDVIADRIRQQAKHVAKMNENFNAGPSSSTFTVDPAIVAIRQRALTTAESRRNLSGNGNKGTIADLLKDAALIEQYLTTGNVEDLEPPTPTEPPAA